MVEWLCKRYSRIAGERASLELLNWRSKFPGLEKKSRKRGISSPTSTNSVCSSSAVKSRWCFRSFSANTSKSLATRRERIASMSSSESAIFVKLFISQRRGYQGLILSLQMLAVISYWRSSDALRNVNKAIFSTNINVCDAMRMMSWI